MDVTPGAIKRLKRLASLIPKTAGGTPRIAEKRQKDMDGQDAINNFLTMNKIHHRSPSDSLSGNRVKKDVVLITVYAICKRYRLTKRVFFFQFMAYFVFNYNLQIERRLHSW